MIQTLIPAVVIFNQQTVAFGGCQNPTPIDFTLPSITVAPYTEVVIGAEGEFAVSRADGYLKITHVGEAQSVRFPSIVSVKNPIILELKNPTTYYCIDSLVAVLGGSILVKGQSDHIRMTSQVGSILTEDAN